LKKLISLEKSI